MKKFLTIVLFCLPAFGQAAYSGPGLDSGPAAYGAPVSGGGPLTYSARTDNCVTGAESGCIGGKTTGEAGSAMSFLGRATDTVPSGFGETTISSGSCPSGITPTSYPASCVAPINATATDPDFGAYMVIVSDDSLNTDATPWDTSWGVGSAGGPRFSPNETLLVAIGSNGNLTLLNFDPVSFHAKTCATSLCVSKTGIFVASSGHGNSTHFANNASIAPSLNPAEPTTFYEQDNLLVNKLVVTSSVSSPGTATMVRTAYADFVNGSGGYGPVLPPITVGANTSNYQVNWSGIAQPSSNGSIGFALGGGYDWLPSWTPADVVGNTIFIYPLTGNSGHHGFQATSITGATGSSEPTWSSCSPTCTDGGVTWTDIGGLTGQGPGFDIVQYSPLGYSRINTRLGEIYRGSGNSAPAGLLTTNDPIACTRATGAPCPGGTTVNLPDEFTLHDASQGKNNTYFSIAPTTNNQASNPPGNWNSGTLTCQPDGASDVWAGAWSSSTTYTGKQTVSYTDTSTLISAYYVATTHASNLNQIPSSGGTVNTTYWTQQEDWCDFYSWTVNTTIVQPATAWAQASGHSGGGYLYGYHGAYYRASLPGNPSVQLSPPNGPITMNPGMTLLATALPADDHPTYNQSDLQDHQPVFSAVADVPSNTIRYTAACYDETCAFANVVTGASAKTYRFAHNYNTGCNRFFSNQDGICSISPLGDIMACGTDLWGTRNSWGGGSNGGVASNNICEAQKATPSTLSVGDNVFPISGNAGNFVYQAIVAGTTNGGDPVGGWCQTLNCTASWTTSGPATVEAIGVNSGRGDMVAIDLLSAHAAP